MTGRRDVPPGLFSFEEIAGRCGVAVSYVHRLVRHGVVDPDPEHPQHVRAEVTVRVRKVVRLQRDLGVNLEGAAVILSLLDRIEELEAQLRTWRR